MRRRARRLARAVPARAASVLSFRSAPARAGLRPPANASHHHRCPRSFQCSHQRLLQFLDRRERSILGELLNPSQRIRQERDWIITLGAIHSHPQPGGPFVSELFALLRPLLERYAARERTEVITANLGAPDALGRAQNWRRPVRGKAGWCGHAGPFTDSLAAYANRSI